MGAGVIPLSCPDGLDALRAQVIARTGLGSSTYRASPRSPWPSELLALVALGSDRGVRVWLEGGTYHGMAAEVLARATPDAKVTTVEIDPHVATIARERLAPLGPRVQVLCQDAREAIPLLADSAPCPVGVFLDGPTGFDAAVLAHRLIATRSQVQFVGCHDMCLSVPGRATPARAALEELGRYEPDLWTCWATDDEEYVAWAHNLDDDLRGVTEDGRSGWRPYEYFAEGQPTLAMRSYGPTVTFLLRVAK
jgi:hypothetical protein